MDTLNITSFITTKKSYSTCLTNYIRCNRVCKDIGYKNIKHSYLKNFQKKNTITNSVGEV